MDNLQFWLYVIIGVIYLITQVRKKSKEQSLPPQSPAPRTEVSQTPRWKSEPQTSSPAPKTISFEDLLREITEAKSPKSEPEYKPYSVPEYTNYDDEIPEEGIDSAGEEVTYTYNDPMYKEYEEGKSRDYAFESLENTRKLENVKMDYGRFRQFETASNVNLLDLYTRELRDPEGFKKAVILTEVLKPKYF
jgi:hypothetical protein